MPSKPQTKPALILERETNSSIELTRNAKGDYQWSIKLYAEGGDTAQVVETLRLVDADLRDCFLLKPEATG